MRGKLLPPVPRGSLSYLIDLLQVHQLLCLCPCGLAPAAALTAVVAVLWAASSLDGEKRAALHLTGVPKSSPHAQFVGCSKLHHAVRQPQTVLTICGSLYIRWTWAAW
jgi:hypothetical protein